MVTGSRVKAAWVCHSEARAVASTVMRADQVMAICSRHAALDADYALVNETGANEVRDALLCSPRAT